MSAVDLWLAKQDLAWQSHQSQSHSRWFFLWEATSVCPKGEVPFVYYKYVLKCLNEAPYLTPCALSFPLVTDQTGKQCGSTVESTPGSGSPQLSAYGLYTMWVLEKLVSADMQNVHLVSTHLKWLTLLSQSLSFYNYNKEITEILNDMDVYVLPVLNPDGYKYTWTKVRGHTLQYIWHVFSD